MPAFPAPPQRPTETAASAAPEPTGADPIHAEPIDAGPTTTGPANTGPTSPDTPRRPSAADWVRLVLGILVPVLVIGMVAEDLLEQERFGFEAPLMLWLHDHSGPGLTALSLALHVWGGPAVMGWLLPLTAASFWLTRQRTRALLTLLSLGGALALNLGLKVVFNRPRPELWPRLVEETSSSFPSGHATVAAALGTLAALLAWRSPYRWPVLVLATGYAFMMGLSRMVLGVHFPTDVLCGWLTGLSITLGVYTVLGGRLAVRQPHGAALPPAEL